MTRILLLTVAFLMMPLLAFSQSLQFEPDQWEFSQYAPPDTSIASVHGLAFDAEGKLWTAGYYPTVDEEGRNARAIHCLEEDMETFCEDTPIYGVEHADSTLRFHQMTGMTADHNGDIIVASHGFMYEVEDDEGEVDYEATFESSFIIRIDHQTGEALTVKEMEDGLAWHPTADDEGFVYISAVLDGHPVHVLDEDLENVAQADAERGNIARTITVNSDGTRIYQPLNDGRIKVYESDIGPFGEYEHVEDIAENTNSGGLTVDPSTGHLLIMADGIDNAIGIDPEHLDEWSPCGFYALDPENDYEVVDSFSWFLDGEECDDDTYPVLRTLALNDDGSTFAVGSFAAQGVQIHTREAPVSADDPVADVPEGYELDQNYPNPFNPSTNIEFTIPESQSVTLTVYDMLGREIEVLVDQNMQAGTHSATFNASDLSSGTYIYRLEAGGHQMSKQMMFVK